MTKTRGWHSGILGPADSPLDLGSPDTHESPPLPLHRRTPDRGGHLRGVLFPPPAFTRASRSGIPISPTTYPTRLPPRSARRPSRRRGITENQKPRSPWTRG
ncbi:MAG: hypothetical protein MZU97_18830 [Bacillus subtilis]|nr:hypothetical protein [Bacillus subtilis]